MALYGSETVSNETGVEGAGLGLRRVFLRDLLTPPDKGPDFLEVVPENWIGVGGGSGRDFRRVTEPYPLLAHGLSLNLGGPVPLDREHLAALRAFLDDMGIALYSEHMSFTGDEGQLYDLLPIPFTEEAVDYVAERIGIVQEELDRPLAVENSSYYAAPGATLGEAEFLNAVVAKSGCRLLLDVNNVYVNSINHGYDPRAFIDALPAESVAYIHVAGHRREAEDLAIDTHGTDVPDPVWDLLDHAYRRCGTVPTLLERDTAIPPLPELLAEVEVIRRHQRARGMEAADA